MLIALLILAIVLVRVSGISQYLTFENLLNHRDMLRQHVNDHYTFSAVCFITLYLIVVALSIPGSAVLSISGGFLFGTVLGVIYANIAATLGSACIFLTTRYLIGAWLQKKYAVQLEKFNGEMTRHGSNYLLTLRSIPIFPFFLVNIFAGLTRVPFWTFLWTTSVGIIPGDAAYTFGGSQLGTIDSARDTLSVNMLIALTLLALFSLVPVVYDHFKGVKWKTQK